MAAGSGSSAAGVLAHLSKASNSSSDSKFEVDDTISTISTSEASSEARDGNGSSATNIDLDSTSGKAPSLLSVLKQAKTSDLFRKRIIRNNLLPKGKKRKVSIDCSLKSVSPRDNFLTNTLLCLAESSFADVVGKKCHLNVAA